MVTTKKSFFSLYNIFLFMKFPVVHKVGFKKINGHSFALTLQISVLQKMQKMQKMQNKNSLKKKPNFALL